MALANLDRWSDATLAGLRVLTGALLAYRTWDAVPAGERIVGWLRPIGDLDLPASALLMQLPTLVQFACGVLLILGLLTRWAGLIVAVLFAFVFIRAEWGEAFRSVWPTLALILLGLHFATSGPGRWALDSLFGRRGSAGGGKRR